jgi:hypothetical protein
VGTIIDFYSASKMYPTYGFGGRPTFLGETDTKHCFNLNGKEDPSIKGIDGILKTYWKNLEGIKLSGPTYFGEVVVQTIEGIEKRDKETKIYDVLLILTDGAIHDMELTKKLIVEGSNYPFSMIIVGIGESNEFDKMDDLDSDNAIIKDENGRRARRDIV